MMAAGCDDGRDGNEAHDPGPYYLLVCPLRRRRARGHWRRQMPGVTA